MLLTTTWPRSLGSYLQIKRGEEIHKETENTTSPKGNENPAKCEDKLMLGRKTVLTRLEFSSLDPKKRGDESKQ